MSISSVTLAGGLTFANDRPLTLIGGMNVIEDRDTLLRVAEHMLDVTRKLGMGYVFKASFDKLSNKRDRQAFVHWKVQRAFAVVVLGE